jgi:hypothetical protein
MLFLTLCLSACGTTDITPGAPDLTAKEFADEARRATMGDSQAIKTILGATTVANDHALTLKWADRLAKLNGITVGITVTLYLIPKPPRSPTT